MRKIITLFCILLSAQILYAQKIFTQITFPGTDAVAIGGVMGVQQDRQGYIWILSKRKGLYRYDGSHFELYNHNKKGLIVNFF